MYLRYAIYFIPDGLWGDLGASWLGWDARIGKEVETYTPVHKSLVERPRKYGFHATIKAPFKLNADCARADLETRFHAYCSEFTSFQLTSLKLSRIGYFFAFTAPDDQSALVDLSSRVVRDLDTCRAPLSDHDIARRRKSRLTPEQDAYLLEWGYPYVMDQFKFHITLTGPVRGEDPTQAIETHFAPALHAPLMIDSLSLMGEREDGQFVQLARAPLSG